MSSLEENPLSLALRWLSQHARFPLCRLGGPAETLVLLAAIARADDAAASRARFLVQPRDGAKDAALRAHAMRRSLAHYKCDNSAKV